MFVRIALYTLILYYTFYISINILKTLSNIIRGTIIRFIRRKTIVVLKDARIIFPLLTV